MTCFFATEVTVTPKTNNSDHVFSLWRVFPCMEDTIMYVQEHSSVYKDSLACCATKDSPLTLDYIVNFSKNVNAKSRGCDGNVKMQRRYHPAWLFWTINYIQSPIESASNTFFILKKTPIKVHYLIDEIENIYLAGCLLSVFLHLWSMSDFNMIDCRLHRPAPLVLYNMSYMSVYT